MYSVIIAPILGCLLWSLPAPPSRVATQAPENRAVRDDVRMDRLGSVGFGDNLEILAEDLVRGAFALRIAIT